MTFPEQPQLPNQEHAVPDHTIGLPPAFHTPEISPAEATADTPRAPETLGRLDVDAGTWQRISPKYARIELVGNLIFTLVIAAVTAALWYITESPLVLIIGGAIIVIDILITVFIPRRARAIGYLLREDDLLFRRGLMWQRFVAVPYGRMQLVDINRGPLARTFGLAELKFVTAATGSNVVIPGLPFAEAEQLRDRLVAVAESRRTGL